MSVVVVAAAAAAAAAVVVLIPRHHHHCTTISITHLSHHYRHKTYSFCFFFGPGLARGLGTESVGLRPLLLPGLGPVNPFRRGVSAAGAPAGVEAASEALSDGGTGCSAMDDAGEASLSLGISVLGLRRSDEGNRHRRLGESLRTTMLEVIVALSERWGSCRVVSSSERG